MNGVLNRLDLRLMTRALEFAPALVAAIVVMTAFWLGFRPT